MSTGGPQPELAPGAPRKGSLRGLILFLVGIAALGIAIVAGVWIWWFRSIGRDVSAHETTARAEGRAYAVGKTGEQCVEESLRRTDACGNELHAGCRIVAGVFLDDCLRESTPTPDLCRHVPLPSDTGGSVAWHSRTCRRLGHSDTVACGGTLAYLQTYCLPK